MNYILKNDYNDSKSLTTLNFVIQLHLRVPHRGQHSPSGTVAFAHGIKGHEILRHTVAEFCGKHNDSH